MISRHILLLLLLLDCQNGDLRLQGGPSASEGTVEICFDNVWGNILETGFGDKDASLVCNLLGFFADGSY